MKKDFEQNKICEESRTRIHDTCVDCVVFVCCTMAQHWVGMAKQHWSSRRQDVENRFLNIYMRSSILIKYFVYGGAKDAVRGGGGGCCPDDGWMAAAQMHFPFWCFDVSAVYRMQMVGLSDWYEIFSLPARPTYQRYSFAPTNYAHPGDEIEYGISILNDARTVKAYPYAMQPPCNRAGENDKTTTTKFVKI